VPGVVLTVVWAMGRESGPAPVASATALAVAPPPATVPPAVNPTVPLRPPERPTVPVASATVTRVADVTAAPSSRPGVGEGTTAGKPSAPPARRADSASPRVPSDMDDVGDPFAEH
jgi:hypothetical protein